MHVLITGSSGQIGTNLALQLLAEGHKVTGVDWRKNEWTDAIQMVHQNLAQRYDDFSLGIGAVPYPDDIELILHLAAYAKVHELVEHPLRALDNVVMTCNVLEFARARNIPVILGSSREAYGNIHLDITREDAVDLANAASPYAASKIACEAMVHSYGRCYGMRYLIFRFSNVYGRYDCDLERMERVIPLFVQKISKGEPIVVFGADKVLDFTYVDDCLAGIRSAIDRMLGGQAFNTVINLAYGKGSNLIDLTNMIAECVGRAPVMTVQPARAGEVTRYVADISAAQVQLGYQPKVPLAEGIRRATQFSLDWFDNGSG